MFVPHFLYSSSNPVRLVRCGSVRFNWIMEQTTLEAIQFNEEIQGLMAAPAPETANSFTALLELPPTQAVELFHSPERAGKPPRHSPKSYPLTSFAASASAPATATATANANLTFPSNAALIDRAARFSVFAGQSSNSNSPEVKRELPETDSNPSSTHGGGGGGSVSDLAVENQNLKTAKRKEREKKVNVSQLNRDRKLGFQFSLLF